MQATLPETNSSPLKINGWNMTFPFGIAYFQGRLLLVSGSGGVGEFLDLFWD